MLKGQAIMRRGHLWNIWMIVVVLLAASVLGGRAFPEVELPVDLQSSHSGRISKIVLVYTWTAEMGLVSVADILRRLPEVEVVILSQFSPGTEAFRVYTSKLTKDGLGRDSSGKPRIHFIQDARAYGPWPRDQALVDDTGRMWVSPDDHHQLRDAFSAIDTTYGIHSHDAPISFTGGNILSCGGRILVPDRMDSVALATFLSGEIVRLPSPAMPERFHLDLVIMPLSDTLIAVGDDRLARQALLELSREEQAELVTRWMAEFAASANNLDPVSDSNRLRFRRTGRPELILMDMLREKLRRLEELLHPGVFEGEITIEPDYQWDDLIAKELEDAGFHVVRVPFWPGDALSGAGTGPSRLPVISYVNSLVWESGILMPVYGVPSLDSLAMETLEHASGKKVCPVRGGAILGFGSSGPHCLTLEFRD